MNELINFIQSKSSATLILYCGRLYIADWIPKNCKDKCKNCPINSKCANEDVTLCEQFGLNINDMHITNEIKIS